MSPTTFMPSALSTLISGHAGQPHSQTHTTSSASHTQPNALYESLPKRPIDPTSPYTALALTVRHALQHQHYWTSLTIHTHSPLDASQPLPRPILSGLPPSRLYVHPDDQAEELEQEAERKRQAGVGGTSVPTTEGDEGESGRTDAVVREPGKERIDREWVLPTHLREKWSLARFAEVFDAIGEEPSAPVDEESAGETGATEGISISRTNPHPVQPSPGPGSRKKRRRGGKRLLLAILSEDSAVSYYVVHDGIVKPRQN